MTFIAPPQASLSIALIGECMIELQQRSDGELNQSFGGDTLNTAVYLRRLVAAKWQVSYVTALGDDSFSDAMCTAWASEGLDLSLVQRLPGRLPGLYCIQTDAQGERRFLYWRNEAAVRECFTQAAAAQVLTALDDYCVFYLSGVTLAVLGEAGLDRVLPRLIAARARGAKLVFDNNYRPRLWRDRQQATDTYQRLLPHLDLALLTLDDEQALFEEADVESIFKRYRQMGVNEVVIKRGGHSCLLQYHGALHEVAATRVARVIDSTAAGGAFSAAYLACRLQGGIPQQSAAEGHRLAGRVIQYPGAIIAREAMPGSSA